LIVPSNRPEAVRGRKSPSVVWRSLPADASLSTVPRNSYFRFFVIVSFWARSRAVSGLYRGSASASRIFRSSGEMGRLYWKYCGKKMRRSRKDDEVASADGTISQHAAEFGGALDSVLSHVDRR